MKTLAFLYRLRLALGPVVAHAATGCHACQVCQNVPVTTRTSRPATSTPPTAWRLAHPAVVNVRSATVTCSHPSTWPTSWSAARTACRCGCWRKLRAYHIAQLFPLCLCLNLGCVDLVRLDRCLSRCLSRYFSIRFGRCHSRYLNRYFSRRLGRCFSRYLNRYFGRCLRRCFGMCLGMCFGV